LHQLAFVKVSALLALVTLGATSALAPVTVLYAGSLVTPMEGPVADALRSAGVDFHGEPGGSKKLANFIAAGVRSPDVFISVDPSLVAGLGSRVASSVTFAQTSLGIAWSDKSHFASVLASVQTGKTTLLNALETPGLRIGRTDPQLDPKGVYTIAAMKEFAGPQEEQRLLGSDGNPDQIFPEEDLLARVETGEIDAGFFYRTEAIARHYRFVPLPAGAASRISYALAVMRDAPHPEQAKFFADFILHGKGREVLEAAGLEYVIPADSR